MSYILGVAVFAAGFLTALLLGGGLLVTVFEFRRGMGKKRRRGLGQAYKL